MRNKLLVFILTIMVGTCVVFAESVFIDGILYSLDASNQTAAVSRVGNQIRVDDYTVDEWNLIPSEWLAEAVCPQDAVYQGLKSVKVFADSKYINILVECDNTYIPDTAAIPFHVFINTDNSDLTGGYGANFTDANEDIMLEGYLDEVRVVPYIPGVYKWWGEVGATGWEFWTDPRYSHGYDDCWGAVVCEGALVGTASQYINNMFEIQIDRTQIPATWNSNQFGIGFEILQNWHSVGVLPQGSPTAQDSLGRVHKLTVPVVSQQTSSTITDVVIPSVISHNGMNYSVVGIGENAFKNAPLTSISIPNSVTSIGENAFYGCSSLNTVTINSNSILGKYYSADSNLKNVFGEQVKTYIIGDSVTNIGFYAFYECNNLTSITIPNSVTSIGYYAFYNCWRLTSITIPISVTRISGHAFFGCTGLTAVHISDIAAWCAIDFGDTGANPLYCAHNLYLNDNQISALVIPGGITSIGESAFVNCSGLTSITLPNSVTSIGDYAFWGCSGLTSLTIPNSVINIGAYAFASCSGVKNITLSNNLTSIEMFTFADCSALLSISIPNSVLSVGYMAFAECSRMEKVTFGTELERIDQYAFDECKHILDIYSYAYSAPVITSTTFSGVSRNAYVWVPENMIRHYQIDTYWNEFQIFAIGAVPTTSDGSVIVQPSTNDVVITWPVSNNAAAYSLTITKGGETVCTLTFNSSGQLTSIAFAPSKDGKPHMPAAQLTAQGYQFTVNGLNPGTTYSYNIYAADALNNVVASYNGSFTTDGYQALDDINISVPTRKFVRDGHIYILRGDKVYDATGHILL